MYPTDWHTDYGRQTAVSAQKILSLIIGKFPVASSVEVGCGDGHWTIEAERLHRGDSLGLDGPWTNRTTLLLKGLQFEERDFSSPFLLPKKYDLGICLEVAEHINEESADGLVDSLALASDLHLFGAAIPLQGGAGHINERWQSWWCRKFVSRGFCPFDFVRPIFWSDSSIHYWYRQNIIVYVKAERADLIEIASRLQADAMRNSPIMDLVHPEKFLATAAYDAIHFKSLFKKLPKKLLERVRSAFAA